MWIGNANIKLNSVKSYNKIINVTVEVSKNYNKIQYVETELRPPSLQISNEIHKTKHLVKVNRPQIMYSTIKLFIATEFIIGQQIIIISTPKYLKSFFDLLIR